MRAGLWMAQRGCGDARENCEGSRAEADRKDCVVGHGGRRSEHHGDWAGAVVTTGAEAGGIDVGSNGSRGSE